MNSKKNSRDKENKFIFNKCWYQAVCELECDPSCLRYVEMKYLVDNSGIPVSKQYPVLLDAQEDYDQFVKLASIKDHIKEFVDGGQNLYITSVNTGNGKTSWAIKLLLKYFDQIWAGNGLRTRGLFIHVPTLLLELKNFSSPLSEEYKQSIIDVDLVVWDEIASTSISNYDYSNLLMFLENRLLNEKSNIFTSNSMTKKSLEEIVGIKLASRIWNTSEIIEFRGKDKRGCTANNK